MVGGLDEHREGICRRQAVVTYRGMQRVGHARPDVEGGVGRQSAQVGDDQGGAGPVRVVDEQIAQALGRAAPHGVDPSGEQITRHVVPVRAGQIVGVARLTHVESAAQECLHQVERHVIEVLPQGVPHPPVLPRAALAREVAHRREDGLRIVVRLGLPKAEKQ